MGDHVLRKHGRRAHPRGALEYVLEYRFALHAQVMNKDHEKAYEDCKASDERMKELLERNKKTIRDLEESTAKLVDLSLKFSWIPWKWMIILILSNHQ